MKQYFDLEPGEKKQEWLLLLVAIVFCLTIATGIYFEVQKKDHDNILVPSLFFLAGCWLLIYSINAFGNGNLISKWTPAYIFKTLPFLTRKLTSHPDEQARRFVVKLWGIIGLIISMISFIMVIVSLTNGFVITRA